MRILARGGLGNQLFQLAYLHGYAMKYSTIDLAVSVENFSAETKESPILELLRNCSHLHNDPIQMPPTYSKFLLNLLRFRERFMLRAFTNLIPDLNSMEMHEKEAFKYVSPKKRLSRMNLPINGYFQNWRYIEDAWPMLGQEFDQVLKSYLYKIRSSENHSSPKVVIHIRGGDFLDLDDHLGLLPLEYYKKALSMMQEMGVHSKRIAIATNDQEYAKTILRKLEIDEFQMLDPDQYTAWETLAILSQAELVICSNSTFSWWGGFLCVKNGGKCISPDNWYRFKLRHSGVAMNHPEYKTVKNAFERLK